MNSDVGSSGASPSQQERRQGERRQLASALFPGYDKLVGRSGKDRRSSHGEQNAAALWKPHAPSPSEPEAAPRSERQPLPLDCSLADLMYRILIDHDEEIHGREQLTDHAYRADAKFHAMTIQHWFDHHRGEQRQPDALRQACLLLEEALSNWGSGGANLVAWMDAHSVEVERAIVAASIALRGSSPETTGGTET